MHPTIAPLHATLGMNTDLLLNCLDGLSDAEATIRISNETNHVAFLAAHVAAARYYLAGYLGRPLDNPLAATLADVNSIAEMTQPPTLAEIRTAWEAVSRHLDELLPTLTAERITAPSAQTFPIGGATVLEGLAFLTHHESYHLGQIALLRKHLGRGAMAYDRR